MARDGYELRKEAQMFGWPGDWGGPFTIHHVWDVQGLIGPYFFGTFYRITKS
jgi:hypothetical protein